MLKKDVIEKVKKLLSANETVRSLIPGAIGEIQEIDSNTIRIKTNRGRTGVVGIANIDKLAISKHSTKGYALKFTGAIMQKEDYSKVSSQDQIDAMRAVLESHPMQVSPVTGKATTKTVQEELKPQPLHEAVAEIDRINTRVFEDDKPCECDDINEGKYLTATTLMDTRHGGYPSVTIPKGTYVTVDAATNLPESSPIDYWLVSARNVDPKLAKAINIIKDGNGIGFKSSDLKFKK